MAHTGRMSARSKTGAEPKPHRLTAKDVVIRLGRSDVARYNSADNNYPYTKTDAKASRELPLNSNHRVASK